MNEKEIIEIVGQKYTTVQHRRSMNDEKGMFVGFVSSDKNIFKKIFIGMRDNGEMKVPLSKINKTNIHDHTPIFITNRDKFTEATNNSFKQLKEKIITWKQKKGYNPYGVVF